ncbi:MAG: hypothetical protein PHW67_02040 [Bacilli bacterium]|nr:hypothetical protein [Bacilli bacterium]
MPKKPNRTDLQNYVPAGNGDESGEYRGGTSTSEGMHDSDCENYRKVLEAKKEALGNAFNPASKPEEELVRDPNKQSTEFNKEKYFKTYTLNDKDTSFFVSKYDEMNDFGKKQIAELSSKMDTRFDRSLSGTGSFVVHLNDLNGGTVIIPGDDNRANRVMAHEYGHAIDFNFGEEGVFASSSVHLSNGRTMEDAVCNHANAVDRSRISDLFYEFHDEVGKLTSKVCEQEGISKEDIERATSLNTELARTEAQFYHETYNNRELQGRKEEIMNKKVAEKGFSPSEIDTLKKYIRGLAKSSLNQWPNYNQNGLLSATIMVILVGRGI